VISRSLSMGSGDACRNLALKLQPVFQERRFVLLEPFICL